MNRTADNVWSEVEHRCTEWQENGVPIFTLAERSRSIITGVDDKNVYRLSDRGRTGLPNAVSRREITRLWTSLVERGETSAEDIAATGRIAFAILHHAVDGIGFLDNPYRLTFVDRAAANRPFGPADVSARTGGLVSLRGQGHRGGGGEGDPHRRLKEAIKQDPLGTLGEAMSYEAEDLVQSLGPVSGRMGTEVPFLTGDRVDLLMKDEAGNYVVIEVEPLIGPSDHIGFHQAGKYRILLAMDRQIAVERVRALVAATRIDRALREVYSDLYGIEWREVPLPD